MTMFTLNDNQKKALEELLSRAVSEQQGAAAYEKNLTTIQAGRDTCYANSKTGLDTVGVAGIPATITELHMVRANGAWNGEVWINEPIPTP